jgi:hypothetical protein
MAKGWGETQAPQGNERKEITRLRLTDRTTIRLVGDVLPRYVYWVVNNEGARRPVECLSFDRDEEIFNDKLDDPIKETNFEDKPGFAYVCNVIDRADNQIKLFDIKKTIYSAILDLARDPEYGDPADPVNGYDITIIKESTGPKVQNVKYSCRPGRSSSPLTEAELALEQYDLDAILKRINYDEQKEWLIKNTSLFMSEENRELDPNEEAEDL